MMSTANIPITEFSMGPFVLPLVIDPSTLSEEQFALYLAVIHHGLSCFANTPMTPASKDTVMRTADAFLAYPNKHGGPKTSGRY